MRYLCLYRSSKEETGPPSQDELSKMGALIEEMSKAGVLLSTEGCHPSASGFKVRVTNGDHQVIDGPFTEAKEVVGGLAIINVPAKDEAIYWTKRFLSIMGEGESEVRRLHEQGDFAPSTA
jgi:hypothetical protein